MKFLKFGLLISIFAVIVGVFYNEEIKYLMPTPIPENLKNVPLGSTVNNSLPQTIKSSKKIKLIHFFNPNCPCSKFNKQHVIDLARAYGNRVDFYSVIEKTQKTDNDVLIEGESGFINDNNGQLAHELGVYATPQAVILSENNTLLFRGNFNRTRYCTNTHTQFAKQALDSILAGKNQIILPIAAAKAYGCSINK